MGLFNSYMKEGPGVDKNEPKKRGFFLFFDVVIHKASKLLGANCLLFLTSLPWIVILYFFAALALSNTGIAERIASAITAADNTVNLEEAVASISIMLRLLIAMGIFVLWGSGPSSAAYSYVNRCFTRSEPVWVWSDGKDKFIENFKQGMLVILIDAVILVFSVNAMLFYYSFYASTHSFIWMLLTYIMVLMLVVYTFMHPYIYQIMVTFECNIGVIYKNALIISLAKLPGNVFTTLISAAVVLLIFNIMDPLYASLFLGVFGLFVSRYVTDFYAARVIEKNMLRNMKAKQDKAPQIEYLDDEEDAAE